MEKQLKFKIVNAAGGDPYVTIGLQTTSNEWWRFGRDNLFPQAIAILNRRSTVHRGILQSKARYIVGKGITCDEKLPGLVDWLKNCNAHGEHLIDVLRKVVFDRKAFGNAYIEIVTNPAMSFLNVYHQDATKCRLSKDKDKIYLHHDWRYASGAGKDRKEIPIYPAMADTLGDGCLRSIIHLKDYEPEFENYGIMDWIAGLDVSAIAYKTDRWNISRLDNSFNSSAVLVVSGEFKTDDDWEDFQEAFDDEFVGEGKQGKVLLLNEQPGKEAGAGTRVMPIPSNAEGDWKELHSQSSGDLVIAHGWFRSLAGMADNTGFDTQRILNEYEVALNTVIIDEQEKLLNVLRRILSDVMRIDPSSLAFVNRPPATSKPPYMKVWEARKADGLPYDENDAGQQIYLSALTKAPVIQTPAP